METRQISGKRRPIAFGPVALRILRMAASAAAKQRSDERAHGSAPHGAEREEPSDENQDQGEDGRHAAAFSEEGSDGLSSRAGLASPHSAQVR